MGHGPKILQFENWNLIENSCLENSSNTAKLLERSTVGVRSLAQKYKTMTLDNT